MVTAAGPSPAPVATAPPWRGPLGLPSPFQRGEESRLWEPAQGTGLPPPLLSRLSVISRATERIFRKQTKLPFLTDEGWKMSHREQHSTCAVPGGVRGSGFRVVSKNAADRCGRVTPSMWGAGRRAWGPQAPVGTLGTAIGTASAPSPWRLSRPHGRLHAGPGLTKPRWGWRRVLPSPVARGAISRTNPSVRLLRAATRGARRGWRREGTASVMR